MEIKKETIAYGHTGYFSKLVDDYINKKGTIQSFYKYPFTLEAFKQVIEDKQKQDLDRNLLVKVLKEQYASYSGADFEKTKTHIELLGSDKTFAVTTAHQPNIFLGPLYTIYKSISAINLAEQLKKQYPTYNFVPVFWVGGEDHDAAELNHIHLFNKTLTWNDETQGSFGRRNPSSLQPVLDELKSIVGESEQAKTLFTIVQKAYNEESVGAATRYMLQAFLGVYGLVVIDGDNAELKKKYLPVLKEELFNQRSFEIVNDTIKKLEANYDPQAKPREINLFYLKDNTRSRIVKEGDNWKVLNTDYSFTKGQLEEELNQHPECFSPNVILRPLYQEMIVPSVAFIGGGAEVAYFSEMKELFECFKVNYPVVVLRNSVLWVDSNNGRKWQNLRLDNTKLFKPADVLVNEFVKEQASSTVNTGEERQLAEQLFSFLKTKAEAFDKSILPMVEGENVRFKKFLDTFEDKLIKAEKKKHETSIQQINSVKEKLFPNNFLQERYDNFIPYYIRYGQDFITALKDNLNPIEQKFTILEEL